MVIGDNYSISRGDLWLMNDATSQMKGESPPFYDRYFVWDERQCERRRETVTSKHWHIINYGSKYGKSFLHYAHSHRSARRKCMRNLENISFFFYARTRVVAGLADGFADRKDGIDRAKI